MFSTSQIIYTPFSDLNVPEEEYSNFISQHYKKSTQSKFLQVTTRRENGIKSKYIQFRREDFLEFLGNRGELFQDVSLPVVHANQNPSTLSSQEGFYDQYATKLVRRSSSRSSGPTSPSTSSHQAAEVDDLEFAPLFSDPSLKLGQVSNSTQQVVGGDKSEEAALESTPTSTSESPSDKEDPFVPEDKSEFFNPSYMEEEYINSQESSSDTSNLSFSEEEEIANMAQRLKDNLQAEVEEATDAFKIQQTILDGHQDAALTEGDVAVVMEQLTLLNPTIADLRKRTFLLYSQDDRAAPLQPVTELAAAIQQAKVLATTIKNQVYVDPQHRAKLPAVKIPDFDGNELNWESFENMFTVVIHNDRRATSVEKLQHLISKMKGTAQHLVSSYEVNDVNYPIVWNLLKERYGHVRRRTYAYLEKLHNIPALTGQSAAGLQSMVDTVKESLRGLQNLDLPVDQWDTMINYMIIQRLDTVTRRDYEESLPDDKNPSLDSILKFVSNRSQALLMAPTKKSKNEDNPSNSTFKNSTGTFRPTTTTPSTAPQVIPQGQVKRQMRCSLCQEGHSLFNCLKFKTMTVLQRSNAVKERKLCINCFSPFHSIMECKSDRSCVICNRRHNTLLHFQPTTSTATPAGSQQQTNYIATATQFVAVPPAAKPTGSATTTHHVRPLKPPSIVLLATALVKIVNQDGHEFQVRALIDSGSQCSLISEATANRLHLKRKNDTTTINGAAGQPMAISKGITNLILKSNINNWHTEVTAIIIPKVSTELPQQKISSGMWDHILGLQLADPQYNIPGPIDLLIGADIYSEIVMNNIIKGEPGQPVAHQTTLGYVLLGKVIDPQQSNVTTHLVTSRFPEFDLSRFWKQEEQLPVQRLTPEEQECKIHFANTHQRDECGRYHVHLPFKEKSSSLGQSREIAIRRWIQVEKRLQKDPDRQHQYTEFMKEYLSLGHMRLVPNSKLQSLAKVYYMPHHFILKESSTTKLRVVFDASAASSNGRSLNDNLMVGPTVQPDLWSTMLRWRLYLVAVTADIEKLYRQIGILPPDENYQRILWRPESTRQLLDYELITVTYGTASAPYQATETLNQLADDEKEMFPIAAQVIKRDFYMDDFMGGGHSLQEAIKIQNEVIQVTQRGQFNLRKWSSNFSEILQAVEPEQRETALPLEIGKTDNIKALGIQWSPTQDHFEFKLKFDINPTMTMRGLLSNIARIYDPLGYLAPAVIKLKLFMRQIWSHQLTWDQPIPNELQVEWTSIHQSMKEIEKITIPRYINYTLGGVFELHGFSDASEKAIAACVYLRGIVGGEINSHLVASKTRVAPMKHTSLPRLELTGALLLSQLMKSVVDALQVKIDRLYYWTDSTIVLHWISQPSSKWKTYVANRVAEIQDITKTQRWFHVKSEENAADCASRGLLAAQLRLHQLWWHGPQWLMSNNYPTGPIPGTQQFSPEQLEERKVTQVTTTTNQETDLLQRLSKYSNWWTTRKIAAYVFRFINNSRVTTDQRSTGILTVKELMTSEEKIVKLVQQQHFKEEFKALSRNEQLSKKSPLLTIHSFLDSKGLIRVGGRLSKSPLPENRKHPIVLPRKNHMVNIIIDWYHQLFLHGGTQLILSHLVGKYHILHAKRTIRFVIQRCIKCIKFRAESSTQIMADLPASRVTPARAFDVCGVDLAGPYILKNQIGRNRTKYKGYIILFTCFTTRAIHLEVVSDQSAITFMMSLNRFIARRGLPSHMYCDNGGNFEGTANELQQQKELLASIHHDDITQELAKRSITWHFSPARSPHFGAVWEIGVKLIKYHIRRTIATDPLTLEEFETLLAQVEAMVNSRPISALTSNPDDLEPLTPGHFLIGSALNALPEPDLGDIKINRLSRYQLLQRKQQEFWKRWKSDYLSRLQNRPKWMKVQPNFKVGDLAILMEDNLPPRQWRLARILKVYPGNDDQVRVVKVRTNGGYDDHGAMTYSEFQRPIVKLIRLPVDSQLDEAEPSWGENEAST